MIPFAERLATLLHERGLSQNQLALRLQISRSTITGWLRHGTLPDAALLLDLCNALDISADWLLGRDSSPAQNHAKSDPTQTLQWIENLPAALTENQREQLTQGLQIFHQLVVENRPALEIRQQFGLQTIRFALQAIFRSGTLQFTHVARHADYEIALQTRYPFLREVVVADVPARIDDTILRTELVASLAATALLSRVVRESAVGLGSGYTMLRLCELSVPSIDQFSGTRWVPLVAFPTANTTDYAATTLARLMAIRHPGSHAIPLTSEADASPEMHAIYEQAVRNLQTIFVSVSGVDRRDRTGGAAHVLSEFRSADLAAEAPHLREAYAKLADKTEFGAEILRYLLDADGNIISHDPAVGYQADLNLLRYHAEMIGRVCIIAARAYKTRAVQTCLHARLANALVIDSEIAAGLLE